MQGCCDRCIRTDNIEIVKVGDKKMRLCNRCALKYYEKIEYIKKGN